MAKKTYEKLTTDVLVVESEGGVMAASVVDSVKMKIEVDEYVTFDKMEIGFD